MQRLVSQSMIMILLLSGSGIVRAEPSALPSLPPQTVKATQPSATALKSDSEAEVPEKKERKFSYGNSDISVLFYPGQIEKLKNAIRAYEIVNDGKPATFTAPVVESPPGQPIVEPQEYPVFYLSTIAYDGPNDWTIWVSGHKITSRKNDTDVKVISVSRENVTLAWLPSYHSVLTQRRISKKFADSTAVKNKLAAVQSVSQDEGTGEIRFTLRQNQSLAIAYFSIFEGFMENAKLEPLMLAPTGQEGAMPGASPAGELGAMQSPPGVVPDQMSMPSGAPPMPGQRPTP